jgi:hypothetical protein
LDGVSRPSEDFRFWAIKTATFVNGCRFFSEPFSLDLALTASARCRLSLRPSKYLREDRKLGSSVWSDETSVSKSSSRSESTWSKHSVPIC